MHAFVTVAYCTYLVLKGLIVLADLLPCFPVGVLTCNADSFDQLKLLLQNGFGEPSNGWKSQPQLALQHSLQLGCHIRRGDEITLAISGASTYNTHRST